MGAFDFHWWKLALQEEPLGYEQHLYTFPGRAPAWASERLVGNTYFSSCTHLYFTRLLLHTCILGDFSCCKPVFYGILVILLTLFFRDA